MVRYGAPVPYVTVVTPLIKGLVHLYRFVPQRGTDRGDRRRGGRTREQKRGAGVKDQWEDSFYCHSVCFFCTYD